jgi:CheY-like chemotaxis protein
MEPTMSRETVGRPMEILLVEDNLADARLAIEAFKDGCIKHRLTLVRDGSEALEFLHQEGRFARAPRPDLILLDLQLPKVDGRQLLVHIRSDFDLKEIPVVILTASDDHEDMLKSQLLQVEGYMTKPVEIDKFLNLVRQLKRFWLSDVILPAGI